MVPAVGRSGHVVSAVIRAGHVVLAVSRSRHVVPAVIRSGHRHVVPAVIRSGHAVPAVNRSGNAVPSCGRCGWLTCLALLLGQWWADRIAGDVAVPSGTSRPKSAYIPTVCLSSPSAVARGAAAAVRRRDRSRNQRHSASMMSRPAAAPPANITNAENTAGRPRPCQQTHTQTACFVNRRRQQTLPTDTDQTDPANGPRLRQTLPTDTDVRSFHQTWTSNHVNGHRLRHQAMRTDTDTALSIRHRRQTLSRFV